MTRTARPATADLSYDDLLRRDDAPAGSTWGLFADADRGMAELGEYKSIKERLKHAKPFLASTWNWNYLTFDADVKAGLGPFRRLVRIKDGDVWNPWSFGLTTGVDIPVTKRSMLCLNAQYSWFVDQGDDFSGPAIITYWKRFF